MSPSRNTAGGPVPVVSLPAVIRADELYTWSEVCRRLRWRKHSARQAQRMGLKPIKFGSRFYVVGASLLAFFEKLGQEQAENSAEETKL